MSRRAQRAAWTAFAAYAALMIWLLFLQRIGAFPESYSEHLHASCNFVPLYSIRNFLRGALNNPALVRFAVVNLLGNVVMFVPLGFLLPAVFPRVRAWHWTMLTVLALLLAVESIQLFTKTGSWDIDDILLNLLGAAIGRTAFAAGTSA